MNDLQTTVKEVSEYFSREFVTYTENNQRKYKQILSKR